MTYEDSEAITSMGGCCPGFTGTACDADCGLVQCIKIAGSAGIEVRPWSGAVVCWYNKHRAFGSVDDPFTDAANKELMHSTSTVRADNNHVDIKF